MTPGPRLDELIVTVRADAKSDDALDQLAAASSAAAELEAVADAVLSHFVDECRRSGRSWSEISGALGVSKQAAHQRFSFPTTARARSALRAAADAARSLGHGYIGTEHVLLGLYEPSDSVAARVLEETGITRAQVEQQILLVAPRASRTVTDPPFTPRAAKAIERATVEAVSLGHNYIGTEHLLLALFADPDGLAAAVLADLGAELGPFEEQVVQKLSGFARSTPRPRRKEH